MSDLAIRIGQNCEAQPDTLDDVERGDTVSFTNEGAAVRIDFTSESPFKEPPPYRVPAGTPSAPGEPLTRSVVGQPGVYEYEVVRIEPARPCPGPSTPPRMIIR